MRETVKFAPDPYQGNGSGNVSEDCLYLNIWTTYWVNFAKRGDPNGEGLPPWSAFSDRNPQVMCFNQKPYVAGVPSAESLKVLDAYFAWRRTPEGEAWAK